MKNYLFGIFFSLLFLIIAGAAIYVIVAIIKNKQDFLNPKGDKLTEIINIFGYKQNKVTLMIQAVGGLLGALFALVFIILKFFLGKI